MAEVVGVIGTVGSFVGLAELSASILHIGYSYLAKVKRAPKEIRLLLSEVASLELILTNLEDIASDRSNNGEVERTIKSLSELGTIETCRTVLGEAERCIRVCEQQEGQDKDTNMKNFGRRLLWPFKEGETKELMQKLKSLRESFTAALAVDSTVTLRRIEASSATTESHVAGLSSSLKSQQESDLRDKVFKWLCSESSSSEEELESALLARHVNTGDWFFTCDAFKSSMSTNSGLFWLNGIPGCGKTVLLSTVIDRLRSGNYVNHDDAITYFYFDQKDAKKQSPRSLLVTLVSQLLRSSADCAKDALSLFQNKIHDSEEPARNSEYITLIQTMSQRFNRIFIILDALDENENAKIIIGYLTRLLTEGSYAKRFRALISTRNNSHMEWLLADTANFRIALHELCGGDISEYVASEVKKQVSRRGRNVRLLEDMMIKEINGHAEGLFLQAKLQIDYICSLKTPRDIRKALNNLQSGLETIYDQMIRKIIQDNAGDLLTVRKVFKWVLGAVAPLALDALSHAVSLSLQDTSLDDENIADDLTDVCGSFVCFDQNSLGDRFIRPAHLSVVEYFCSDHVAASEFHSFHVKPKELDLQMALICIKYISLEEFDALISSENATPSWDEFYQKYPLYNYAARNWHIHLQKSQVSKEDFHELVVPHLQWFLDSESDTAQYHLWQRALAQPDIAYDHVGGETRISNTFYCSIHSIFFAIKFELTFAFEWIFAKSSVSPNHVLSNGHNLLTCAVSAGQMKIVQRLLDLGADPNLPDCRRAKEHMVPLHYAAVIANLEISALLLQYGAGVHIPSRSGATAFHGAVQSGAISVMKLLRSAGASIDVRTRHHWTPVYEAVRSGHVEALSLLLHWQANAHVPTLWGDTPLAAAKELGHTEQSDLLEQWGTSTQRMNVTSPASVEGGRNDTEPSRAKGVERKTYAPGDQEPNIETQRYFPITMWQCCTCGCETHALWYSFCVECQHSYCSICVQK